jgi:hypothetical protein
VLYLTGCRYPDTNFFTGHWLSVQCLYGRYKTAVTATLATNFTGTVRFTQRPEIENCFRFSLGARRSPERIYFRNFWLLDRF